MNDVLREAKERPLSEFRCTPRAIAELVALIDDDTISGKIAKNVFAELVSSGGTPRQIVDRDGLAQVTDESSIEPDVDAVIAENAETVQKYRDGNQKVLGFLVGQVMRVTKGSADPTLTNRLLRELMSRS